VILGVDIPGDSGYVLAAYAVFFVLVLVYMVVIGMRIARVEREVTELNETVEKRGR
jgi:CcmD family protein